jgi:hypothetical protein
VQLKPELGELGASNIFKSADRRDSLSRSFDVDIDLIPIKRPAFFYAGA